MKIKRFKIRTLLLAVALASAVTGPAYAARVPKLSSFFRSQIHRVSESVEACSLVEGADGEEWDMTRYYFGVSPYVGVGVPGFFQIQVVPEIIFIWTTEDL